MFRILLSNHYDNVDDLLNPRIGVLKINNIGRDWTANQNSNRYVYDPHKAINSIATRSDEIDPNSPTLIDTEHINNNGPGRKAIAQILEIFHQVTGYSCQVGIAKYSLSDPTLPYQKDRYGEPDVLENVQFIIVWAKAIDLSEWHDALAASCEAVIGYHKPVYADISPTWHQSKNSGRPLQPAKVASMIQHAHACSCNGAIIRDYYDTTLGQTYYESIVNMVNRINR